MSIHVTTKLLTRFWSKVDKTGGCWIWTGCKCHGYGYITVDGKFVRTHRLAWVITYGEVPDDRCVLHACDVRACCNPAHLFLGTVKDNADDAAKKGRSVRGERQHGAILTSGAVREIRRRLAAGEKGRHIARDYGVCESTISKITRGKHWRHVR